MLNYSTKIPANTTLGEIQSMLARHKATRIQVDYDDDGQPNTIRFAIKSEFGPLAYALSIHPDGVFKLLLRDYDTGSSNRRPTSEQAVRVAWRCVKDWVEAQIALVESGQASFERAMYGYMLGPDERTTAYELWEGERRLALPPGKAESA